MSGVSSAFVAATPSEKARVRHPDRDGVSVRDFPFPYRAGFSMSNDVDGQERGTFLDWHAFVNGRGVTSYGDGLGLEITDSFTVYGGRNSRILALYDSIGNDEPLVESPETEFIVRYSELGWFDQLHSLGDWQLGVDPAEIMKPHQLTRAFERLRDLGLHPPVWTAHSASLSNFGGPWFSYYHGDNPESPLYALEPARQHGMRYFWFDPMVCFDKFGLHLDFPDAATFRQEVHQFPWPALMKRRFPERTWEWIEFATDEGRLDWHLDLFNSLLVPVPCNDGSVVLGFMRHRGHEQPLSSNFCTQVASVDLDEMIDRRGSTVIYQHFGVKAARGRHPSRAREARARGYPPVLDEHGAATWREIAEHHSTGRLFVAGLARFLDWHWLRENLVYALSREPERWHVNLTGAECGVLGARDLTDELLNGLAFLVPETAPEVLVTIAGRPDPLVMKREADPVFPGMDAVWLPWQSLEWPEKPLL